MSINGTKYVDEEYLANQECFMIVEHNVTKGTWHHHFIKGKISDYQTDIRKEQKECVHLIPSQTRIRLFDFYREKYGLKYHELKGKRFEIEYCSVCRKLMTRLDMLSREQIELLQFNLDLQWRAHDFQPTKSIRRMIREHMLKESKMLH